MTLRIDKDGAHLSIEYWNSVLKDMADLEADIEVLGTELKTAHELLDVYEKENERLREFANTIMYTSDGKRRSSLGLTFTKAIEDLQDALKEGE